MCGTDVQTPALISSQGWGGVGERDGVGLGRGQGWEADTSTTCLQGHGTGENQSTHSTETTGPKCHTQAVSGAVATNPLDQVTPWAGDGLAWQSDHSSSGN